tara:strand:- start:7585 stop:7803 length:219 start_codon:yes stop_codon:yes gene_type:complete
MSEFYVYSDDDITVVPEEDLNNIIETQQQAEINKLIKDDIKNEIKTDNFEKPKAYKNINTKSFNDKYFKLNP